MPFKKSQLIYTLSWSPVLVFYTLPRSTQSNQTWLLSESGTAQFIYD